MWNKAFELVDLYDSMLMQPLGAAGSLGTMAFCSKVGNLLKQSISQNGPASMLNSIRCMATSSKLFIGGTVQCRLQNTLDINEICAIVSLICYSMPQVFLMERMTTLLRMRSRALVRWLKVSLTVNGSLFFVLVWSFIFLTYNLCCVLLPSDATISAA